MIRSFVSPKDVIRKGGIKKKNCNKQKRQRRGENERKHYEAQGLTTSFVRDKYL